MSIFGLLGDKDRLFEYQALDDQGKLLVSGHTVHACTDLDGRMVRFPSKSKELVEQNYMASLA